MSTVIILAVLGLLASVSPSTIVVFILLLATARARVNAVAFLIGWSVSLIIVFAVSYGIGGVRATQHGSGRTVVEVIEIMLGAALAFAAARQWRHRDRPRTSSRMAKKFNARLTQLHPWEAATVGVLEQPWTLTAAAAVVLVRDHSAFLVVVFAFLAFALLSTATIGLIFLYFARRPGQAEAHLADLKDRLVRAGPAIFAIVSAAVGVFLIIDGVIGIVGS
jgi:Sap, sulfolipid-1-addressing protein